MVSARSTEPLCQWCCKIKFPFSEGDNAGSSWRLAPGKQIQRSRCPFCKLVAHSFTSSYRTDGTGSARVLPDSPEVWASQARYSGQAGPPSFSIHPNPRSVYVVKATTPTVGDERHQGYMHRTIEPAFDVRRLLSWVSACEVSHRASCKLDHRGFAEVFPALSVLRLVDVEQECLVELQQVPQYVAPSYVWGEVRTLRLSTMNRSRLTKPGATKAAWGNIPRTIQDAILLVKKLERRYLWVDTLCLVQDDPADLGAGVNVMDQIYEAS
ncbi:heterokaryon incompatibility protein [Colletotrichum sojae]|uniref:Heterokaryon incompatibility protein n=1 Tax=Colletotrichum sojae TaxID=2175907 RepID=A0A8H6J5J1_9PEZI|nr:heterokaryon incompatibility protein [Colletotrichum sojae]